MIKNKSRPLEIFLACILWGGIVQAQESINSAGGNATGGGGTVAYSIGQVVYTTNSGSTGSTAQGVQHAIEILTVGTTEVTQNVTLTVSPNPTTENLTLQINNYNNEKLSFQLFDMQGKLLNREQVTANPMQINMNSLPTAAYILNVLNQENKKIQSFKINKI